MTTKGEKNTDSIKSLTYERHGTGVQKFLGPQFTGLGVGQTLGSVAQLILQLG